MHSFTVPPRSALHTHARRARREALGARRGTACARERRVEARQRGGREGHTTATC